MRGARRAKEYQGMCPTCARRGGKPIVTSRGGDCPDEAEKAGDGDVTAAAAEASTGEGTKKVNLEEVEPDPTTSLPTEHKALLAVAKKEGVYM